jgi:REP element-mobilizing transposase RayT
MKNRTSIRLKGFDYTQPASYFITICAHQFQEFWGEIIKAQIKPNEWGQKVIDEWYKTAEIRKNVSLDAFVLMPNHLHGIITIHSEESVHLDFYYPDFIREVPEEKIQKFGYSVKDSLPSIIKQFKSCATQKVRKIGFPIDTKHWQRGYYERVIRNPNELVQIQNYIYNNPYKWEKDKIYFQRLLDEMDLII